MSAQILLPRRALRAYHPPMPKHRSLRIPLLRASALDSSVEAAARVQAASSNQREPHRTHVRSRASTRGTRFALGASLLLGLSLAMPACGKRTGAGEAETGEVEGENVPADLWTGVPELEPDPSLYGVMAPKPGPAKPPQVGQEITAAFPPELPPTGEGETAVATGPVHVLRYGPEGGVQIVDAIRVAFDQSMVPLTTIDRLKEFEAPLKITPMPKGEFRWMGTRVLAFVPEGRLPYSTTYTIEVPKGARSVDGNQVEAPVRWTIVTPRLSPVRMVPYNTQQEVELEQDILVTFNQDIDRKALGAAATLTGGSSSVPLEVLPPEKWKDLHGVYLNFDEGATGHLSARTMVLRPTRKLAPNTKYTLTLPAGAWGEGPDKSTQEQFTFNTYAPLVLGPLNCGWEDRCEPSGGLVVQSTTSLDDAKIAEKVRVTPEVEDLVVTAQYSGISISGKFEGETTYTVEVDAGVHDSHGQVTTKPFRASKRMGKVSPNLMRDPPGRSPAVIEAKAAHSLKLKVAGISNLEVMARSFGPDEIASFVSHNRGTWSDDNAWPDSFAGKPATVTKNLNVTKSHKREIEEVLDLDDYRKKEHPFIFINARSERFYEQDWHWRSGWQEFIQITDIAFAGVADRNTAYFVVTRLSDQTPIKGASIEIFDETFSSKKATVTTGADGRASVDVSALGSGGGYVLVRHEDDAAFADLSSDVDGNWVAYAFGYDPKDQPMAFMFTEREPHKPGETVHIAGLLRERTTGPRGGTKPWGDDRKGTYTITSPRGIEIAKGDISVGSFGSFSFDVDVPADADTGQFSVSINFPSLFGSGQYFYHSFAVEEYRAPEFAVEVARPDDKPLFVGDELIAEIRANYLFGAPLVGGEASWSITRSESFFRPPGDENSGFTFGKTYSWWWGGRHGYGDWGGYGGSSMVVASGNASLDDTGKVVVTQSSKIPEIPGATKPVVPDVPPEEAPLPTPPQAVTLTIQASVTDANRQAIGSSGSFLLHPASEYVGVRSDRTVLKEGEQTKLEAVVVDVAGKRVAGKSIEMTAFRSETEARPVEKNGRWVLEYHTKHIAAGTCTLVSDTAPANCDLKFDKAGTHQVLVAIKDGSGRENRSELTVYVHGKDAVVWDEDTKRVDLVPDKQSYKVGDVAKVLVRSPFTKAKGVLVAAREGIAKEFPLDIEGGATVIELPIEPEWIAGVHLSAVLARGREVIPGVPAEQDLGRPMHATGEVLLDVGRETKTLTVEVVPSSEAVAPGEELTVTVRTKDYLGKPVTSNVVIMVADEGVLSLMGYTTPDPLSFFHMSRSADVYRYALHANVVARDAEARAAAVEALSQPVGGLGLDGTGRGGGGTGEGTIGLGDTGLIGKGGGGGTGAGYGRGAGASMDMEAPAAAAPMEEAAVDSRMERKKSKESSAAPKPARSISANAAGQKDSAGGEMAWSEAEQQAAGGQDVKLRTFFASTAYYNPNVVIPMSGETTIKIPMPENLTSFRIMAVAVDPVARDRFGSSDASVKVRKPIMVRPSLPRFTNLGDHFQGGVMVDNQTETAQKVLVGVRGLNVRIGGEDRAMIEIPAGESREVRFDLATEQVGKMRLQFAAMAPGGRDAAMLDLPVLTPATKQAFADYGMTDDSMRRAIDIPKDVLAGFGGLELSFSSTALNGLEDAVSYLVTYRYECAEQTASRILPIFALGPILDAFPIFEVKDKVARDLLASEGIAKLWLHQISYDGGFGFWDNRESWPYLSAWVTFALLEGKKAGFGVDEARLNRALDYLEHFVRYGQRTRWGTYYDETTRTFALWLLSGEKRGAEMFDQVYAHRDEVPLYAKAFLLSAAHRYGRTLEKTELLGMIRKTAIEDADSVHFAEGTSEGSFDGLRALMHSSVQTDAIILVSLLEVIPGEEEFLAKIMAGIMKSRDPRQGGRWNSTHANAWALIAASRYFGVVEKDVPDYTARAWLDADFVAEQAFKGRDMAKYNSEVPMAALLLADYDQLTISKEGPGKLYYRIGLRYAPADFKLDAIDRGFTVYRTYEGMEETLPVTATQEERDAAKKAAAESVKRLEDGTWQVKAGANVKVTLTVVATDRGNYVVVDDAMPAGFEGQNPRFLTSVAAQQVTTQYGGGYGYGYGGGSWRYHGSYDWWWPWFSFDHTQMRDDRMLLFADYMPAGVFTYSYTARATTIGEFILPPVHAEEMYAPERFGHSASGKVVIVE